MSARRPVRRVCTGQAVSAAGSDTGPRSKNTLGRHEEVRSLWPGSEVWSPGPSAVLRPALLEGSKRVVDHGGRDVGVDVIDVPAFMSEPDQSQDAGRSVLDQPGFVRVA